MDGSIDLPGSVFRRGLSAVRRAAAGGWPDHLLPVLPAISIGGVPDKLNPTDQRTLSLHWFAYIAGLSGKLICPYPDGGRR